MDIQELGVHHRLTVKKSMSSYSEFEGNYGNDLWLASQIDKQVPFFRSLGLSLKFNSDKRVPLQNAIESLSRQRIVKLPHVIEKIQDPTAIPEATQTEIEKLQRSIFPQDNAKANMLTNLYYPPELIDCELKQIVDGRFNGDWVDFLGKRRGITDQLILMTAFNTYYPFIEDYLRKTSDPILLLHLGKDLQGKPMYYSANGNNRLLAAIGVVYSGTIPAQMLMPKYIDVETCFSKDPAYQMARSKSS